MPTVFHSKIIHAPVERVWPIIRDFGALDVWFPFVTRCALSDGDAPGQVGSIRCNTVESGNVIKEKLLELSDRERRMVYAVVEGDVPVRDYTATIRVEPVVDGNLSFVTWTATFDVPGEVAPVAEWVRAGIFVTCLNELERIVVGRP